MDSKESDSEFVNSNRGDDDDKGAEERLREIEAEELALREAPPLKDFDNRAVSFFMECSGIGRILRILKPIFFFSL